MKKTVNIIFPHQLSLDADVLQNEHPIYLVEEYLFFKLYLFHKQKIGFHRASMQLFRKALESKGKEVHYIEATNEIADIRKLIPYLISKGVETIHFTDPTDNWLEKRIRNSSGSIKLVVHESFLFINTKADNETFFRSDKKFYFQTNFYKDQRKRLDLLMENGDPIGGKWTFDTENRKKYPKGQLPPTVNFPENTPEWEEAVEYVNANFSNNPGSISSSPLYPINKKQAEEWLDHFLNYRFFQFGTYEDAILRNEMILNHSVVSPLINVGLLSPIEVLDKLIEFAKNEDIPINSTEGIVRQIIGWREFVRGMYESRGIEERTTNFWNFERKIPPSFYNGTTGILPVDQTIKKVLNTGYCHHIERLMILGNFMLLCEFDPDEVYRWFMELFIDAYDWVMVPNVYGMSQFSDGGLFATKPYIGGSNYIKKMSDYPKGDWEPIWDGLFWRFVDKHQEFFKSNPRMSMMYHSLNRMDDSKRNNHLKNAEQFLKQLN